MSIEENNQSAPQMYMRRNRCFVSFPYDSRIVDTVRLMQNRWYTPKTREWSFNGSCKDEFITVHPNTIELKYDMIIYKTRYDVYFKFIETEDLDELSRVMVSVTYDFDGHVFVIPRSEYPKLEAYVSEKGFHALMRNFEQSCPIKPKIIIKKESAQREI
jgi:hypothetical protein